MSSIVCIIFISMSRLSQHTHEQITTKYIYIYIEAPKLSSRACRGHFNMHTRANYDKSDIYISTVLRIESRVHRVCTRRCHSTNAPAERGISGRPTEIPTNLKIAKLLCYDGGISVGHPLTTALVLYA